jgi:hypothetical protein
MGQLINMQAASLQLNPQEYVGCWYDGARGQYMGEAIQKAAQRYGWTGEFLDSEHEFYHEAWTEAEDYLNGIAPDGFAFGTSEGGGDFMFLPQSDWED